MLAGWAPNSEIPSPHGRRRADGHDPVFGLGRQTLLERLVNRATGVRDKLRIMQVEDDDCGPGVGAWLMDHAGAIARSMTLAGSTAEA